MNAGGGALGVLAGGLLTQYASWRWVLFANVPMAAVALALAGRGIPASPAPARSGRPDVLGGVLATASMTLLVFGVVRTDQYAWASPVTVTTLAAAAALLAAFIYAERATAREPLIRLGLLASRSVAGANAFNLLVGAAMAAAFYFVSFYLQRVLGVGPALTGLMFLPFALGVAAGSVLAVRLGYRLAPRTLLVSGGLLTAAGFAWFSLISPAGTYATDVLGPSIAASIGFGLCLGPVVSTATAGVAPREAGTASGLLNSSRQIGASVGLAALASVAQHRTGLAATPAALTGGYALGLRLGAALLVAAALIALVVLRRASPAAAAARPLTATRSPAPLAGRPPPPPSRARSRPARPTRKERRLMTTPHLERPALGALYAGLGLAVLALIVPYADHATANLLAAHLRDGYPAYSPARIDSAVATYLAYLSAVGTLGIIGWLTAIWAVRASRRWARPAATALFAAGTAIALADLLVRDTSGATGLPALLGWAGVIPCLAGLLAVARLWRRP
jgi:predicted MFS family arabinose efflux permease